MVEGDVHSTISVCRELRCCTADTGSTQVLNALDYALVEEFETAFDENLFGKWVSHLHGRALRGPALIESFTGKDGGPTDSVPPSSRPEENYLVSGSLGGGEVQVIMSKNSHR
jgi:hypothetical protein